MLYTPFVAPQHGGMIVAAGIPEDVIQVWTSTYFDQRVWANDPANQSRLVAGTAWTSTDFAPQEVLMATSFYREVLSKIEIAQACFGVVFDGEPGLPVVVLSVYRGPRDPAFTDDDKSWMRMITRHVSRSLGIMKRLEVASIQNAALLSSFDRLAFGVALLNSDMKVLHLNEAAKRVIERDDGLRLNADGQLEGKSAGTHAVALSLWIRETVQAASREPTHFQDSFYVARTDPSQAYMLQCAPLSEETHWQATGEEAKFITFIVDPSALKLPSPERLHSLFGLTSAQANVALQFVQGSGYKAVAQRLSISEETVRSHVKDIYPKMRVSKQADMVRVILSLSQAAL